MIAEVAFKIAGQSITQIARDLFLEGNWRKALNLLISGLDGITYEQVIDILMCRVVLIGENNNIDLCDDEPDDEYLMRFRHIYPTAFEFKNRYYVPSVYVSGYCVNDMLGPGKSGNINHSTKWGMTSYGISSDDKIWRSLYYAKNPMTALAVDLTIPDGYYGDAPTRNRVILFEEVAIPPFWLPVHHNEQETLEDFLDNGGTLNRVGGDIEINRAELISSQEDEWPAPLRPPVQASDIVSYSGLDPEDAISILSDDDDIPPEIDKDLSGPCAYILPNGAIYNCAYMKHRQLADRILKFVLNREDIEDPEKELEKSGAVRISRSAFDHQHRVLVCERITPSQRSILRKWMDKYPDTDIEDFKNFY